MRQAVFALARHKEQKIFKLVRALGICVFDNLNPTTSLKGVTTGRDLTGAQNGSLSADDLFDAFAQVITAGFTPNTLLMHPLTWSLFIKDATLRHFVLQGSGGTFFAGWNGNPAKTAPWGDPGTGMSPGQSIIPANAQTGEAASPLSSYPQTLESSPMIPNYWGLPFRVIVSPFVPYDPRTQRTDLYIFDSSQLGALVVDHDIVVDEFDDPRNDIKKVKMKERYAIAMLNEGKAVATIRNIKAVPNEVVLPAQATISIDGTIAAIDSSTAV